MNGKPVPKLYGRLLLHDTVLRDTLVTWLAAMSPEEGESALTEYAALIEREDAMACEAWVINVRTQAAALRLRHNGAFTVH